MIGENELIIVSNMCPRYVNFLISHWILAGDYGNPKARKLFIILLVFAIRSFNLSKKGIMIPVSASEAKQAQN